MKEGELQQLIDDLLEGEISEADFLRLEAELHIDSRARKTYYDRLSLQTLLQEEAAAFSEDRQPEKKVVRFSPIHRSAVPIAALAALLMLFAIGIGWYIGGRGNGNSGVAHKEPLATGFGVLAEQSNTIWEGKNLNRGDLLPQGIVTLKSGIAQLELFSGVSLVLEGAAKFEVHSAMEMSIHSGKLRALVPKPARGFRLRTAKGDIVDLGTEFALDVSPNGTDLHVVTGEVEWHPLAQPMKKLRTGQSNSQTPIVSGDFPHFNDLANTRAQRKAVWEESSKALRNDPRLLAYFPFDQPVPANRKLIDQSGNGNDGFIVRAKRALDRWEEPDRALDFSPTGSRVRLSIPGEFSALTLFCWVRIDSLDRWYNSLFLTDGHELHEPHWQIMDDGRIFFSVKARQATKKLKDKQVAYSPPIWTPQLSGQWIQIATVYDSGKKSISHYVNGEPVSREILADEYVVEKVNIGAASIGNWSEPMRQDPHFAVRNLNGSIDEFAIFSAALTSEEIKNLYEKGRP